MQSSTIAVTAIIEAAKTGQIGDGKLFISSIDEVIRVRTEETRRKRTKLIFLFTIRSISTTNFGDDI